MSEADQTALLESEEMQASALARLYKAILATSTLASVLDIALEKGCRFECSRREAEPRKEAACSAEANIATLEDALRAEHKPRIAPSFVSDVGDSELVLRPR